MCELLAMSASMPTDLGTSLDLFRARGGNLSSHEDGWGIAVYEGRAARIYKEPKPASSSRLFASLRDYDTAGRVILAHLRKANPSATGQSYANTHPFEREVAGRSWTFAHNGRLPGIDREPLVSFRPIGRTDSEHAFCCLLDHIKSSGTEDGEIVDLDLVLDQVVRATSLLNRYGEMNYLLSNGEYLFVHTHTYVHMVDRRCLVDGQRQSVVIIATQPLTDDENWSCLVPNTVTVFQRGETVAQKATSGGASQEAWETQRNEAERFKIRKAEAAANAARMEAEKDMYWECS
ncbi:class II glutamine amidotransferase [Ensifer adhaerens]|uniref:class II glutamine amidotransferase n=1 Tax=Ensifer adhaerens TaxID=106592 RepID=UPI003D0292C0